MRVEHDQAPAALIAAAHALHVDVETLTAGEYSAYRWGCGRPPQLPSALAISLCFGGWEPALAAAAAVQGTLLAQP